MVRGVGFEPHVPWSYLPNISPFLSIQLFRKRVASLLITLPRARGSKLPYLPDYENIFIEYLGLDYVVSNLEKLGCTWLIHDRYQEGFDVSIIHGDKKQCIEVKSRGIGEYSGVKNESDTQKNILEGTLILVFLRFLRRIILSAFL